MHSIDHSRTSIGGISRDRVARLRETRGGGLSQGAAEIGRKDRQRTARLLRRRADALDERLADAVPDPGRQRQGRHHHRHRRQQARRFLPRRHRLDVRPFAAAGRARHPPPGRARPDLHAAQRGCARHRPAAAAAFRPAVLADRHDGDRRQPLRAARRPRRHRPAKRSWSSTAAIMARSTRRWCGWSTAGRSTGRGWPANSAT